MSVIQRDRREGNDRRSGKDRRRSIEHKDGGADIHRDLKEREAPEKAIELKANFAEIWCVKGETFFKRRQYEKAKEAFQQAIRINSTLSSALYGIARVFAIEGKKIDGLYHLRKALEIDPNLKNEAKKDPGFKKLWNDKDFENITT